MNTPAFTTHDDHEEPPQDNTPSIRPRQPIAEHLEHERSKAVTWTTQEEQDAASKAGEGTRRGPFKLTLRDGTEALCPLTLPQYRYLRCLAVFPSERMAAKTALTTTQEVRRWRRDPAFVELERDAAADAVDALVADAWSAATEGRLVPIYQMGQLIGYRREYSEKLHVELLKGLRPEVFDRRALKTETTTNNTVIMASPEAIRDAVRRLSPTVSGQLQAPSTTPSLPDIEAKP